MSSHGDLSCPSVAAILLLNPSFYKGNKLDKLVESLGKLKKLRNNQSNMMVMAFSGPAMQVSDKYCVQWNSASMQNHIY